MSEVGQAALIRLSRLAAMRPDKRLTELLFDLALDTIDFVEMSDESLARRLEIELDRAKSERREAKRLADDGSPRVGETAGDVRRRGWIVADDVPDHAVVHERNPHEQRDGFHCFGIFEWPEEAP